MSDDVRSTPTAAVGARPRPWTLPRIAELPKLTALTLASAIGGTGGTGGGGSTVFGLLLALLTLGACSSDRTMTPSEGAAPKPVASVPCIANVVAKAVICGGPLAGPGQEILGGQGVRVILRSTNISYLNDTFRFDVTVQNLSTQTIGTDGATPTGLSVFLEQHPVATVGAGPIKVFAPDTALFTAADQPFWFYPDSLEYQEISPAVEWKFEVDPGVTSFAFTVLVAAEVGEVGEVLRWQDVAGLGTPPLWEVAATSANDIMAIGDFGRSIRFDGTSWTQLGLVTQDYFYGLAALAPGEYVAAGYEGRLFRSKGKIWSLAHERADAKQLYTIWVQDSSHFVAVGDGGAVTWYANGIFTDDVVDPLVDLVHVVGTSDGSLVTVTDQDGLAFTATGPGAWGAGVPLLPADNVLLDIAYDADDVLLLGYLNLISFEGGITHGGAPTPFLATMEFPVKLFPFDRDSLVVLVFDQIAGTYLDKVRFGASPVPTRFTITDTLFAAPGTAVPLDGAKTKFAMTADNALWIKNGGAFTEVDPQANCGCYSGMWGVGDTVWVVDGSTSLWKVVGGTWTELTAPSGAYKIWGFSSDELYVTADSQVWKGDGVGPWTLEATLVANFNFLNDIWGDPSSGLLMVIGDGGNWMTRQGMTWTQEPLLAANVAGVWGCSGSEAWMVSQDGPIFHWQSGVVSVDPSYDTDHGPGNWGHETIIGSSCTDVWVAGQENFVFHWTGTSWDSLDTGDGPTSVSATTMKGPNEVYIGGDFGVVALVTAGGSVTRMRLPTDGDRVDDLWRLLNGGLVAIADDRVLRGLR